MDFVDRDSLATHQDWLEAASRVLDDSGFDETLVTELLGGLRINPLYTSDDLTSQPDSIDTVSLPSTGMGRRASNISGLLNGWEIRQKHWLTSLAQTNRAILTDLEKGVNSIELRVGAVEQEEFSGILAGVLMDIAAIAPIGPDDNVAVARNFLAYANSRNIESAELLADLSCDPIGRFATQGGISGGINESLTRVGDLAASVAKEYEHVTTVRLDGTPYAHAGADPVTELAAMASTGLTYLRALSDSGVDIEDAFRQILLVVAVGTDQFLDIAKIRAFREIWRCVGESCGIDEVPVKIQASTSLSVISKIDPWVNLLRTTVGCFAAAIGGADIVTVAPFDSGMGVPDDFGMRLARNTHLVLMEEANIHRVIDPVGGSWYVESLTDQLSKLAWERFQGIEKNGGILNELRDGILQSHIQTTRVETERRISGSEKVIVGVNKFASQEEKPLNRDLYPEAVGSAFQEEIDPLPLYRLTEGFE